MLKELQNLQKAIEANIECAEEGIIYHTSQAVECSSKKDKATKELEAVDKVIKMIGG